MLAEGCRAGKRPRLSRNQEWQRAGSVMASDADLRGQSPFHEKCGSASTGEGGYFAITWLWLSACLVTAEETPCTTWSSWQLQAGLRPAAQCVEETRETEQKGLGGKNIVFQQLLTLKTPREDARYKQYTISTSFKPSKRCWYNRVQPKRNTAVETTSLDLGCCQAWV